jgi:hypothetical protein
MLHAYWTSACKCLGVEQTSSLQVILESSNDQDHADENDEWRGNDASKAAVGTDSDITHLNGFTRITCCSTSRDSLAG